MVCRQFRQDRVIACYYNEQIPHRKTLIFVHTIGGGAINWQAQFRAYADHYNVIAYDLYGHGMSGLPNEETECSVTESLLDFEEILAYFSVRQFTMVAHGYGSVIAMMVQQLFPKRVEKLLLINPYILSDKRSYQWRHGMFVQSLIALKSRLFASERVAGNNSVFPTPAYVRSYYFNSLVVVPKVAMQPSHHYAPVYVLRRHSRIHLSSKKIDRFFTQHFKAKIKNLDVDMRFPMKQYSNKINYFLSKYIDVLNIGSFRNLVFEGAGVRGIAYAGAISALHSLGVLKNIKRVAGTSAGSVYAIFIAIGCSAVEIQEIVSSLSYAQFADASRYFIANSTRLLTDYGWHKGDAFINFMRGVIESKTGNGDISFGELKTLTGFSLYITGTNLTQQCAEIYSDEHTPEMKVVDALRISTCIPMFYRAIKEKRDNKEHILVDGGLVWNCPIDIFDQKHYIHNPTNLLMSQRDFPYVKNMETIGFKLDPHIDPLVEMRLKKPHKKIGNLVDFTKAFMNFYSINGLKRHMSEDDWNRLIFIDTLDVSATEFEIDKNKINALIQQGKLGVHRHFAWRMSQDGLRYPQ